MALFSRKLVPPRRFLQIFFNGLPLHKNERHPELRIGIAFLDPNRPAAYFRLHPADTLVEEVLHDGTVIHLDGPTDAELAWCYEHAAFTCYPSLYEGWGLPVSESLAFGRPCLSSDTSSLPEAGAGLTTLLDPYDRTAWRDAVLGLWRDPAARAAASERIRSEYVNVDATATARVVIDTARSLHRR